MIALCTGGRIVAVSNLALFASGIFFGGALDHVILAAIRRDVTPYGVKAGVSGNWLFAAADLGGARLRLTRPYRDMSLSDRRSQRQHE